MNRRAPRRVRPATQTRRAGRGAEARLALRSLAQSSCGSARSPAPVVARPGEAYPPPAWGRLLQRRCRSCTGARRGGARALPAQRRRGAPGARHGPRRIHRPPCPRPRNANRGGRETAGSPSVRDPRPTLRAAYEGVMPLRDTGRAALDTPLRHHARHAGGTHPAPALRPDAIVLPADADVSDPATLFRAVVGSARRSPTATAWSWSARSRHLRRSSARRTSARRSANRSPHRSPSRIAWTWATRRPSCGPGCRAGADRSAPRALGAAGPDRPPRPHPRRGRAAAGELPDDALAQGKRCIQVIHGKGHGSPGRCRS